MVDPNREFKQTKKVYKENDWYVYLCTNCKSTFNCGGRFEDLPGPKVKTTFCPHCTKPGIVGEVFLYMGRATRKYRGPSMISSRDYL